MKFVKNKKESEQASQQSTEQWHKALVRLLDEAIATAAIPQKMLPPLRGGLSLLATASIALLS